MFLCYDQLIKCLKYKFYIYFYCALGTTRRYAIKKEIPWNWYSHIPYILKSSPENHIFFQKMLSNPCWHSFFFFIKFIYLERRGEGEREYMHASRGEAEEGRERILSRLHAASTDPDAELKLTNREIMTWAEFKSGTLNRLSHPGAPILTFLQYGCSHHMYRAWSIVVHQFDLEIWVTEGKPIRWQLVTLNHMTDVHRFLQGNAGFCAPRVPKAQVPWDAV